jgi:hypothetical protein
MGQVNLEASKALYLRFTTIYQDKLTRHHTNDEVLQIWLNDWAACIDDIENEKIVAGIEYCRMYLEWPPSIPEFRRICRGDDDIPSVDQVFTLAMRRIFTHPLTQLVFDEVGSWAFSHDKEEVLRQKIKSAYASALLQFRTISTQKLSLPSSPPVVFLPICSSHSDPIFYPVWDQSRLNSRTKSFDPDYFQERKVFLMNLSESAAQSLTSIDLYDRIRYLRAHEAMCALAQSPLSFKYTKLKPST